MGLVLTDYEARTRRAIAHCWTGGPEGFRTLLEQLLTDNGLPDARIHTSQGLELPGFYVPIRRWDVVIMHRGALFAALGLKVLKARALEDDFIAISEEAISAGKDMDALYRRGVFGTGPRPLSGWLILLEESPSSGERAAVGEPHLPVLPEFRNASYARRYELLLRKLMHESLFDATALLLCTEKGRQTGDYHEPARDIGIKQFLSCLSSHASFSATLT